MKLEPLETTSPRQTIVKMDGYWYTDTRFPFIHYSRPYAIAAEGTKLTRIREPLPLPLSTLKVGVLKRPTASQLTERHEPRQTREGKQAMKEALDQIKELQP